MSVYRNAQRHVSHRGRKFHFVSYDGQPADPKTSRPATEPTWFLINSGKRWAAVPQVPDQDEAALDRALIRWLEAHVFA